MLVLLRQGLAARQLTCLIDVNVGFWGSCGSFVGSRCICEDCDASSGEEEAAVFDDAIDDVEAAGSLGCEALLSRLVLPVSRDTSDTGRLVVFAALDSAGFGRARFRGAMAI